MKVSWLFTSFICQLFVYYTSFRFKTGNAFDGLSTFTSPIDGYYEFSFAGTAGLERKDFPDKDGTHVIVEKNGENELSFFDNDDNFDGHQHLISFNWLMKMDAGEKIRLKLGQGKINISSTQNSIFNGKFIHPL